MRARRLAATLTVGSVALALAACASGAGSSSAATGASDDSAGLAFAKCMRAHGFPHFPDPGGPRPSDSSISILGVRLPPTTDIRAPAFQSGLHFCMKKATGGHPPPALSAAQRAQALQFARCVRAHGIQAFPDPVFRDGRIALGIGSGVDPNSPAFRHAEQACGQP